MTRSNGDDLWKEWNAVADSAKQPPFAPRDAMARQVRSGLPVGMAAVLVVVVVGALIAMRWTSSTHAGPAASEASSIQAYASAVPSPHSSASPYTARTAATFTLSGTPGSTTAWRGFTWTQLPADIPFFNAADFRFFPWRGGYVAEYMSGSQTEIWTSPDGNTWSLVTAIPDATIRIAASPSGLIALAGDTAPYQTWSSSDGVHWQDIGTTQGLKDWVYIVGNGHVMVARQIAASADQWTSDPRIAVSTDGLNWSPVTIESGFQSVTVLIPTLYASGDRFFVRSAEKNPADPSGALPVMWWSDDGRTWTRTTGVPVGEPADPMVFGRDGMMMHAADTSGGGLGYATDVSNDGGKTWRTDQGAQPIGVTCSSCGSGLDGVFTSNGTVLLAIKSDGRAWVSDDAKTWTPIEWSGPHLPQAVFLVLPGGVIIGDYYGAAH
jgi:hypothetical protein